MGWKGPTRMDAGMALGGLAVLVAVAILSAIGYRVMIDVKPDVTRAVVDPAARAEIEALRARLMRHVMVLAGEIGERNVFRPEGLKAAAKYIRAVWTAQGYSVAEEVSQVAGQRCVNLIIKHPGSRRPGEIVLVGAHYDSLIGTSGANDNATGVAVLLEMSAILKQASLARTLRFVAFVNEEPPWFHTERMGSRTHAQNARRRGDPRLILSSGVDLPGAPDAI